MKKIFLFQIEFSISGAPDVFYNELWGKSDGSSKRGTMVDRKVGGFSPLAATGLDMKGAMAVLNTGSFNTFVTVSYTHLTLPTKA